MRVCMYQFSYLLYILLVFMNRHINNFDLKAFSLGTFGKEAIKSFKVSPDAFIQQAIQLAYFRYCTQHIPFACTYIHVGSSPQSLLSSFTDVMVNRQLSTRVLLQGNSNLEEQKPFAHKIHIHWPSVKQCVTLKHQCVNTVCVCVCACVCVHVYLLLL